MHAQDKDVHQLMAEMQSIWFPQDAPLVMDPEASQLP